MFFFGTHESPCERQAVLWLCSGYICNVIWTISFKSAVYWFDKNCLILTVMKWYDLDSSAAGLCNDVSFCRDGRRRSIQEREPQLYYSVIWGQNFTRSVVVLCWNLNVLRSATWLINNFSTCFSLFAQSYNLDVGFLMTMMTVIKKIRLWRVLNPWNTADSIVCAWQWACLEVSFGGEVVVVFANFCCNGTTETLILTVICSW